MEKKITRKASVIQALRKNAAERQEREKERTDGLEDPKKEKNKVIYTRRPSGRNTYRLDARNPFNPEPVYKILEDVMTNGLEEVTYDPEECPQLCMKLSGEIRKRVKALNFDRYKLICVVDIVEKKLQSVRTIAKYLWDHKRDNYAFFKFENFYLCGIAYVFGIYHE